jgi:hypothetical protein
MEPRDGKRQASRARQAEAETPVADQREDEAASEAAVAADPSVQRSRAAASRENGLTRELLEGPALVAPPFVGLALHGSVFVPGS